MSRFRTPLDVLLIDELQNQWRLQAPLVYESDVAGRTFCAPEGFITNFASVPRVPVAYWLAGDTARSAAVIHDYLYSTGCVSREMADEVLLEAMAVTGIPFWRRWPMYWAVRAFGGQHYCAP